MNRDELITLFIENASKVAVSPYRAADIQELNGILSKVLAGTKRIYAPQTTDVEKSISIDVDLRSDDFVNADACVQELPWAIAETGSIVSTSAMGKPIQGGLLTPHHIAVVKSSNIVEKLEDYFSKLGDTPPTNITLETGPSRTADIELTLTIGVHGPGKVTVIVLDS